MLSHDLIVIGAGGHAQSCIDVIEQQGLYKIAGMVGSFEELAKKVSGYSVIATDVQLAALANSFSWAFIGVGQIKNADVRVKLYQDLIRYGFNQPKIISPYAYVSPTAHIGDGTIVMHGAIINAGASVGNNCIINSKALIEHGVTIADHVHISTGAVLNGQTSVGERSFVGSGAIIRENINIGERVFVGMGLNVRHNLKNGIRYIGQ